MRNLLYYFLVDKSGLGLGLDFAGSFRFQIAMNIKTRKKHMNDICGEKNTLRKKNYKVSQNKMNGSLKMG